MQIGPWHAPDDLTRELGLYFGLWTALFLVLRLAVFRRFSATFSNVCVSWVHAMVALALGFAGGAIDWRHMLSNYGAATSPNQARLLKISLGYFVYDSICCELIEHDFPNLFHHISTIVGLAVGVFQHKSGPELTVCLILMEMSSPCLHNRSIFKELGMKDSGLAFSNDLLFGLTFLICRVLFGPFVTYYALLAPDSSNIVKVGAAAIQVVSLFWAHQIIAVVRHKARKRRHAAQKAD